ncbi:Ski-Like Protein [Manis pentadactyla]|nr:Ski-Like Protein [Manis pentadactyla]
MSTKQPANQYDQGDKENSLEKQFPQRLQNVENRALVNNPNFDPKEQLVEDVVCEDDKGKIVEEVMRTYVRQQEKLNSILQEKQQLQMEVEMLSSSKAMKELTEEQQNLQKELESLQNEHAQRMEEFYVEQKDLEKKLEQSSLLNAEITEIQRKWKLNQTFLPFAPGEAQKYPGYPVCTAAVFRPLTRCAI